MKLIRGKYPTMMKTIELVSPNLLKKDYGYAALNILWSCNHGKRTIIFSFIELFPKEFPEPQSLEEQSFKVKKTNQRLYFIRIADKADRLIDWYNNLRLGNCAEMFWQKNEKFELITYEQEPIFPELLLVQKIPFLLKTSGSVRCHFLFETNLSEEIKKMCLEEDTLEWIKEQLLFDISLYPEYIGTICLAAYNPLIRSIRPRLITNDDGKGESILFQIEKRTDVDISKLKLMYIEKRNLGYNNFKEIPLEDSGFLLKNSGDIENIGYAVVCPERGILTIEGFYGFLKSISLNMRILSGKTKVNVPTKDYTGTEESYEAEIYHNERTEVADNNSDTKSSCEKLSKAESARCQINRAKNSQAFFYDNPREAAVYVRNLISKAQSRVIIIDPYIQTRELFKFVLMVQPYVDTVIMTSSLVLKGKKYKGQAQLLQNNINNAAAKYKIKAMVMKGDQPVFHDRFIIIDDEVWLSGNSLADIGNRASILIKLYSPSEVTDLYFKILNDKEKVVTLEEWIKNHEAAKN